MARAGVSYHDIAKAAEAIRGQGHEPTVDRVREKLGTGSKSTIAPLLKRWRTDHGDVADAGVLPSDLLDALKSVYERTQQLADHRIDEAQQQFEISNTGLKNELTEARRCIEKLTEHQKELDQQISHFVVESNALRKDLEDGRVVLVKTEFQRDEALARVSELKLQITELKQENRDIRDHFEHYQQRTADDRQQEREQFRATNQQMQDQLQELRGQLARADIRISEMSEAIQRHLQRANELEQINAQLSREIGEKSIAVEKLEKNLELNLSERIERQEQTNRLSEQLAAIVRQKADTDKEMALLSQTLRTTKAALDETQNKVMHLTDENKVILQEKSVIQGQFKQLQSSLRP